MAEAPRDPLNRFECEATERRADREVTPESVTTFSQLGAERKVVSGGGECAAYGVGARAPVKVFAIENESGERPLAISPDFPWPDVGRTRCSTHCSPSPCSELFHFIRSTLF